MTAILFTICMTFIKVDYAAVLLVTITMTVVSEPIEQQSFEAKSLKLGEVTVYNDRAEVKRVITATLKEVQYQQKATKQGEVDHDGIKKLTAEKTELEKKKKELDDSVKVLTRQGEVLDGVATQVGRGAPSTACGEDKKGPSFVLSDDSLANLTKFLGFYDENITTVQSKLRALAEESKQIVEDIDTLQRRINELRCGNYGDLSRFV
jgi:hypothetical protein